MKKKKYSALWITFMCMCIFVNACTTRKSDTAYLSILNTYSQAYQAQTSGAYHKAIALYKKCISESSSDKYEHNDSVMMLLPKAMVQMLNAYQSASMIDECIVCFDSLRSEANKKPSMGRSYILAKYFKRDIYVLLAYSMSRTDREAEAACLMDSALSMPLEYSIPERKLRDYTYAAGVYYCDPSHKDEAIKYGTMALDEIKSCKNKSGAQWLVAITAKLYQDRGEIGKSIAMCRQGYELAEMSHDTLGMANSKKELADYLYQWGLYDDAIKYISEAIDLMKKASQSNPMLTTVAYTIKAKTLLQKGKKEETSLCLQKARKECKNLPYNSGTSDIDLLMGKMLISDTTSKNNYAHGIRLLNDVSHKATFKLRAQAFFELAKAYLHHGNNTHGEACLDSMYNVLNASASLVVIDDAYFFALNHYLNTGNKDQIIRYSAAINRQNIAEEESGMMEGVAKSLAHFEMEKQENDIKNKMREMEVRKLLEVVGIGMAIFIVIGLVAFFAYKRKKLRQENKQTEQQLSVTQIALAKTSEAKDRAEWQLKKIEEKEVDKLKAGVSLQELLNLKGDKKFKTYFNQAYPYFIVDMRKRVPSLTSKEELYCMLIALNCNNEELATIFNVARSSVVVAKYRIRKKLNLPEGIAMEEYLNSKLTKQK